MLPDRCVSTLIVREEELSQYFFVGGMLPFFFKLFHINRAYIQYFYIVDCRSCFRSAEGFLWGAEPRYELGPASQQADALLSEPRRTLKTQYFDIGQQMKSPSAQSFTSTPVQCTVYNVHTFQQQVAQPNKKWQHHSLCFFDFSLDATGFIILSRHT